MTNDSEMKKKQPKSTNTFIILSPGIEIYLGKFEYKIQQKKGTNTIVTKGGRTVVTNDGKLECLSFLPSPLCRLFSTNCQECVFFVQCPVLVMFVFLDKGV